jgi:hypothetical protein
VGVINYVNFTNSGIITLKHDFDSSSIISYGNFTNQGTITIANTGGHGLDNNGILNNNPGGKINVFTSGPPNSWGINNFSNLTNSGTITGKHWL